MTEKLREEDLFALYSETKAQAELAAQSIEAMRNLVAELNTAIPKALREEAALQLRPAVAIMCDQLNTITANQQISLEATANKVFRAAAAMEQARRHAKFFRSFFLLMVCIAAGTLAGAGTFYYLSRTNEALQLPAKAPTSKEPAAPRKKDRQVL